MTEISENAAFELLQRWYTNSITVLISLTASADDSHEGMITELEFSPGQIVVQVLLVKISGMKPLFLRDCTFSLGEAGELFVYFLDGRSLRFEEGEMDIG